MKLNQDPSTTKPHEHRWLATALAVGCVATAAAAPWWSQTIVWLAACRGAGVVSHGDKFGGPTRTLAHLATGGIVMLIVAAVSQIPFGPRADGDLMARACLIAMNACAGADILLFAWLRKGIVNPGSMEEPPDGTPDQQ